LKILIVGLPKCGTTYLTYKLAANLNKAKINFEPNSKKGLSNTSFHKDAVTLSQNVITKCLYYPKSDVKIGDAQNYYNKKIWIVRDPRDRLISTFLYTWYHKHKKRSEEKFNKTLQTVLLKEENPGAIPFHKIIECIFSVDAFLREEKRVTQHLVKAITSLNEQWLFLKYEDLIDNNIEALENYLSIKLSKKPKNNFSLNRVKRTATYNNWKNWFTPEDVELLQPIYQPALGFLNYDENWKLNEPQIITQQEASEFLVKIRKPQSLFNKIIQKLGFIIKG